MLIGFVLIAKAQYINNNFLVPFKDLNLLQLELFLSSEGQEVVVQQERLIDQSKYPRLRSVSRFVAKKSLTRA